jgi:hypothetical protein
MELMMTEVDRGKSPEEFRKSWVSEKFTIGEQGQEFRKG